MPISGLVLTLAPEPEARRAALAALAGEGRVTLGALVGGSLPVVTETETIDEHEALGRQLAALEGVLQVRLAYYDFSDLATKRELEADRGPT